jgi:hypothetical protein
MGKRRTAQTGLVATLKSGDHRASLEALRDELAEKMAKADPNVVPQFAARLQAVLAELAGLPAKERTDVDELVERRKARRAAANAQLRAKQRRGA